MPDGKPSECDPKTENHCCSKWGFCGPDADHCDCAECVDYRRDDITGTQLQFHKENMVSGLSFLLHLLFSLLLLIFSIVLTNFGGKVRSDRRCGKGEFALDDGSPSECDGSSENPCCSKWGFCGPDADHCACEECVDYRNQDQIGLTYFDLLVVLFLAKLTAYEAHNGKVEKSVCTNMNFFNINI